MVLIVSISFIEPHRSSKRWASSRNQCSRIFSTLTNQSSGIFSTLTNQSSGIFSSGFYILNFIQVVTLTCCKDFLKIVHCFWMFSPLYYYCQNSYRICVASKNDAKAKQKTWGRPKGFTNCIFLGGFFTKLQCTPKWSHNGYLCFPAPCPDRSPDPRRQFLFDDPSPKHVFYVPGPQFVFTGPSPQFLFACSPFYSWILL